MFEIGLLYYNLAKSVFPVCGCFTAMLSVEISIYKIEPVFETCHRRIHILPMSESFKLSVIFSDLKGQYNSKNTVQNKRDPYISQYKYSSENRSHQKYE